MSEKARPCRECPWRKKSLPGYVGPTKPEDWIGLAHSDEKIICHLSRRAQCEGAAAYRANVLKRPRDPEIIIREKDKAVFSSPKEFITHHRSMGKTSAEL